MDLTKCTFNYEPFEQFRGKRDGVVNIHVGRDTHSKGASKTEYAITHYYHITGLYTEPGCKFAYGDMVGTNDAIIFDISNLQMVNGNPAEGSELLLYIAKGAAVSKQHLWQMVCDGVYNEEIEQLKSRLNVAKPDVAK